MSDLVENPEDRFSQNEAQLMPDLQQDDRSTPVCVRAVKTVVRLHILLVANVMSTKLPKPGSKNESIKTAVE